MVKPAARLGASRVVGGSAVQDAEGASAECYKALLLGAAISS
jgi:hypothetical protein